ncbi:MAG: tandem-95 repeat protein [Oscillatoriales cyanobacterium C42_A2020_001]|nr:tandem-95 repeat protein [Leptolyngbyaceae cyanobacterium C42_A2020_001]
MPDTAGNSLATATALNPTSAVQSFPDLVTPTANDYYRFALSIRSSLNLSLTGLDANANLELLNSAGNPLSVGGVLQQSTNAGTFAEVINTALDPGVYFIRIAPAANVSLANYTLNVSAQANLVSTDILWRNEPAQSTGIWYLDQTTFSSASALSLELPTGWTVGGVGDFNKDGKSDIIWRLESASFTAIWFMDGPTLLSFANLTPVTGSEWKIGGTGDFNDDGNTDIIWRNESAASVGIWYMNGAEFLSGELFDVAVGPGWVVSGVGDFNKDGNPDLLWRNRDEQTNLVWFLDGIEVFSGAEILPKLPASWILGGTGDFNQDGTVDILLRDQSAVGNVGIWLMDGLTPTSYAQLPFVQDLNWNPYAPYSEFGEPIPIDFAGNTRTAAFDIGSSLTGSVTYQERVDGATDTDDYYRFSLANASRVSLSLAGLSADLNLQLLNDAGTIIQSSTLGNLSSELITSSLGAGNYFVRVLPNGVSDRSSYSLGVSINNLPILVTNSGLTVSEQGSVSIGSSVLSALDPDNTVAQITYSLDSVPANGTLLVNGAAAIAGTTFSQVDLNDGSRIQYIHNGSETTRDRFIFTVSDGAGGTINASTFSISVTPVNDPPVLATNLGLTVSEGEESSIAPTLLQITDPDSPPESLTYSVTSLPANGTLLLSGTAVTSFTQADVTSGNLRYRQNGSETLTDRFIFTISDGLIPTPLGPNTFSINVLPVNDPPIVATNAGLTLSEGATAFISPTRLQATDPEGQSPVTYILDALPTNGVLRRGTETLSLGQTFTQADITSNQISYIHNDTETTTDSFQFTVVDVVGAIAPPTTFSITVLPVNDAPDLTLPTGTQIVDQETNTLIPGIRVTDVDLGTGEITVTLSAGNGVLSLGRTTGITFLTGDGTQDETIAFRGGQDVTNFVLQSLIYRSDNNFRGTDTISVTISDGGNTGLGGALSDAGVITLSVAPVNEPPVLTVPPALTVREDVSSPISGITVADLDAGASLIQVSLFVANGTVSLNSTAGVVITTGTGTRDKSLVFTGSLAAINTVLAGLSYLGDRDFSGSDTLTISVSDSLNNTNGIPFSDTETIAITVTPQNDAPILTVPGAQTVNENTDLRILGISVSDVDATGDLTVNLSSSSGRVSLSSIAGLTFDAGDGSQDDAVIFRGTQAAVNDALRTLIYRANPDFNGSDTISINVSDGGSSGFGGVLGDSDAIAINVLGVNNAPVVIPPTAALTVDSDTNLTITGLQVADPDAGGGELVVSLLADNGVLSLSNTAGLTFLQGDGTADNRVSFRGTLFAINTALAELTYRSYPGFTNAFDRITISVNDNGNTGIGIPLSDTEVLFVSVGGAVNRPPIAVNDTFSVAEEGTLAGTSVLANDSDPDFTLPLTAQLVAGPANSLSFAFNTNGSFTYAPAPNFSGSDTFTYRVTDALGGTSNTATVVINVSATNDPPTAVDDSFTTAEDQPITNGAVLANDTDIDNTLPLSTQLINGPANAIAFSFSPNGTFSYTPRENFSGSDRFTYVVVDALGAISNTATVSLTITPVADAPLARNDGPFSVSAGGTLSVTAAGVLSNDTDVDTPLANLTASVVVNPANGSLTLNPNGSFLYRPTGVFSGVDTFVYQASDGTLTSNLATVTISVGANNPPVAVPESFTLPEDGSVTAGNVLTNDTDADGNLPLTATLITAPTNAPGFTLSPTGTFNYQPTANFNGVDSFVYQAIDSLGGVSTPATVTFSVTAVNDAPVAVNDTISLSPGATLSVTAPGILVNDTDVDSLSLTVVSVSTTAFGNLTLNPNGSFTYRPNPGFTGTDSFTYRANDGSQSSANTATVSLIVTTAANIAPIANPDILTVPEDAGTTGLGTQILANDTDPDGNLPLTVSVLTQPTNGSLSLSGTTLVGYDPIDNFVGVDIFTYAAVDSLGGVSNPTTVTLSVTAVNDAPVAVNDSYPVATNGSLNITAPGVLANDTDVDSPALTATLVATTSNGVLSLNPNGSFLYQPNPGFSGVDSFTYLANDGSLNSQNTATVNLTVSTVVNSAPTATPDVFNATEDTPFTTGNVLANDTDPDNNIPLTASVITNPANALTFTLSSNGSFSYVPTPNFSGVDTFTYVAVDALGARSQTATATVSVAPVNDAPVANNNTFSIAPAGTLNITLPGVLADDSDADGNPLTALSVTAPTSAAVFTLNPNGSFTYVPQAGFSGNDSFTYQASDGTTVSNLATVTISVTSNAAPTANPESFTVPPNTTFTTGNVLANDTDPDNNIPLTASVVAAPANALSFTLRPDGSFSYQPALNFSGNDTFTYVAVDSLGGTSNPATVTFSVAAANRAPLVTNDTEVTSPGVPLTITAPGVLRNDTDPDGNPLTASLLTNGTQGTATLSPNGSFVYTPNAGFVGNDSFTYVANDGTINSAPGTVTIRVNGAPIATNNTYSAAVGSTLNVAPLNGVLSNDTDPNGDSLFASVVTNPTQGVLSLNSNGAFTYVPNAGATGIDTFTYQATDGLLSSTATVTLSLRTNVAPVAQGDAYRAPANGTLAVGAVDSILRNDSDADGNSLSATLVTNATRGSVTLNSNGTFTYVPQAGFEGLDSFVYRASDGITVSGPATVTLTVSSNTPPVANNDSYSSFSGIPQSIFLPGVLGNDSDVNGNALSATVVTAPANGVLTLNPNGSFVYTANSTFQGVDTFTYRAFDGIDNSTATVSISVTLNLPPNAQADTYSVPVGQTLTVGAPGTLPGVLANDTDPEGSPLTALTGVTQTANGGRLIRFNGDGSFIYVPASGFVGADSFTYRVRDNVRLESTATVVINVV